jgi:putative DNA methylase
VQWEQIKNADVLDKVKLEIARSVARDLNVEVPVGRQAIHEFLATHAPPVLDPFAGGGSIPLEAQRLGLRSFASDLNPVAVLINKAMVEIPAKFVDNKPVHQAENNSIKRKQAKEADQKEFWGKEWEGIAGLVKDVRFYGELMQNLAYERINHLYPPVKITDEILTSRPDLKSLGYKSGDELPVIAWLWARTVKCPNPACGENTPLASKWILSKRGSNWIWVKPDKLQTGGLRFEIMQGGTPTPGNVTKTGASCLICGVPISFEYVRDEGKKGQIGEVMTAIASEEKKGRVYFSPTSDQIDISKNAHFGWSPDTELPDKALGYRVQLYGMQYHSDLFLKRQLTALSTFCELIHEIHDRIITDALSTSNDTGETKSQVQEYANAVCLYLAFVLDKLVDLANTLCSWEPVAQCPRHLFSRQAVPMVWDFAEGNPIGDSSGSWNVLLTNMVRSLESQLFSFHRTSKGCAYQHDAVQPIRFVSSPIVCTDPPYYDKIFSMCG